MESKITMRNWTVPVLLVCLFCCADAIAKPEPDACIELGALAYDDWTSLDGGGSGLPAGEPDKEYLRCKSCHGWDRLGEDGGYVRRTRNATRPNAGLDDLNRVSRNIAPGMGDYYHVRAEEILHEGTGRAYEDGSGSWVALENNPSQQNVAAHASGFTLGNRHPDFSTTGSNAGQIVLTQDQVDCLVDFINFGDSDPKFYFFGIDTKADPVQYGIHPGASSRAGRTFYVERCLSCHGEPEENHNGANDGKPQGGILAYLAGDGKYSEFVHKARWGIPDTAMTRAALGWPDSQDMIDVMLYLQELSGTVFVVHSGISGSWYDVTRNGEGFMIDVARDGVVVTSFYTYDSQGNQYYLIGSGMVAGNSFEIDFYTTSGGIYGPGFDPELVVTDYWGKGEFSFAGCYAGIAEIIPNPDFAANFEPLAVDITRLTTPESCSNY